MEKMLIRLLEIDYSNDDPYESAKYLATMHTDNYDTFVRMLTALKDNGEEFQIAVRNEWYTVDTWVFKFPENGDMLPCINVYVL